MTPAEVEKLLGNLAAGRSRTAAKLHVSTPTGPFREAADGNWVAPCVVSPARLDLTLPLPPSWNRAFKVAAVPVGGGRARGQVYKSKEAKAYRGDVERVVRATGCTAFPKGIMLVVSGLIVMERAGCDIDDRLKVLFDALNGLVWEDDEQVAELGPLRRVVDSKRPRVELHIEPISVDRYGAPL